MRQTTTETSRPLVALAGIAAIIIFVSMTSTAASEFTVSVGGIQDSPAASDTSVEAPQDDVGTQSWIEAEPLRRVNARTAARIQSGSSGGEIDGAVIWTTDGQADDDRMILRYFVDVNGRDLLSGSETEYFEVDFHAYLLNRSGGMVSFSSNKVILDNPGLVQRVGETGLKLVGELKAAPGEYSLRILVQNQESQRYFFTLHPLVLGTFKRGSPTIVPPMVPDAPDRWVIGVQNGLDGDDFLDSIPAFASWPSAMPTWRIGEPLELTVGSTPLGEKWQLAAHLTTPDGAPVTDPDIEIGPPRASTENVAWYPVTVGPVKIRPGEYRLEFVVSDIELKSAVVQALPVVVHDETAQLVWTDPVSPRKRSRTTTRPAPELEAPAAAATTEAAEGETADEQIAAEQPAEPAPFVGGSADALPAGEPLEGIALTGVGARGAALLLSGQSGGEVEGSVVWTTDGFTGEGENASIRIFAEVDGGDLLAGSRVLPVPVAVYAYLVRSTGELAGHFSEGLLLNSQPQAQAIDSAGLRFFGTLEVPAGLYSFRMLVINRATNRFFLSRREVDLRRSGGSAPRLLPPLVEDALDDAWIVGTAHGIDPAEIKFEVAGLEIWPSAMPVWRADRKLEMLVGSSELDATRHLSARVFDRMNRLVGDPPIEIGSALNPGGDLLFYRASVASPDVPEGRYRLVIFATDSDSGESVSQSMMVVIHNQGTDFAWTDPMAPGADETPVTLAQPAEPTAEERDELAMRSAYLEALNKWSRGQSVEARRALAALEHPMESSVSARSWRRLINVERIATLEMAQKSPAALMAIALFHRDMYDWYLSRHEPQLARHSWQMASMMARITDPIEGVEASQNFSENMLLDLASRLVRSGEREAAQQLLEAAAELAPDSAPALLGLGALHERSGATAAAVEQFSALIEAHPDHAEGQLRLAVNRARQGADGEAEELCRKLLSDSTPLWIRVIAYQQLGVMLIDSGRTGEAFALLDEGVARIPNNQRLRIQLAHALDSAQRPREAAEVIEEFGSSASQQSTSPRYRYSTWPDLEEGRVRDALAAALVAAAPALEEALQ